jgi:DNA-directed RNA polymerase subunit RPC12/RpoP
MYEEEIALENFIRFVDFFQTQPLILQITILLFLTGITVGAIAFSYYMIKLVVVFFIKLVKGVATVVKSSIDYRTPQQPEVQQVKGSIAPPAQFNLNHGQPAQGVMEPQTQYNQQIQQAPQSVMNPSPITGSQTSQAFSNNISAIQNQPPKSKIPVLHCSNCGNAFTEKMIEAIKQTEMVYCEYCGQGFMIEKP